MEKLNDNYLFAYYYGKYDDEVVSYFQNTIGERWETILEDLRKMENRREYIVYLFAMTEKLRDIARNKLDEYMIMVNNCDYKHHKKDCDKLDVGWEKGVFLSGYYNGHGQLYYDCFDCSTEFVIDTEDEKILYPKDGKIEEHRKNYNRLSKNRQIRKENFNKMKGTVKQEDDD